MEDDFDVKFLCREFIVLLELRGVYGRSRSLKVYEESTNNACILTLEDEWFETRVKPGDSLNVVGGKEDIFKEDILVSGSTRVLLILNPHLAIQVTTIIRALTCHRKAYLSGRITPLISQNVNARAALFGSLIHLLIEKALKEGCFSSERLVEIAEEIVAKSKIEIWSVCEGEISTLSALISIISPFQRWIAANYSLRNNLNVNSTDCVIREIMRVEEQMLSRMYGLKGNIDCILLLEFCKDNLSLPCVMEIKTGKTSLFHRAQVMLYLLLLSESYNVRPKGMVYYVRDERAEWVSLLFNEIRSLFVCRNLIASYMYEEVCTSPPMLQKKRICEGCEFLNECAISHLVFDNGNSKTSGLDSLFDELTDLSIVDKEFIKKWLSLLDMEKTYTKRVIPSESQHLYPMVLSLENFSEGKHIYSFKPLEGFDVKLDTCSYALGSSVSVALKTLNSSPVLRGSILDITDEYVFIASNNSLKLDLSKITNNDKFYIFIDESVGHNSMAESILLSLFVDKSFKKLKNLVVDLGFPIFTNTTFSIVDADTLNYDQYLALKKVDSALDYALILGMPGTGKSMTIIEIIKSILKKKCSVLFSCYTHTAVDHILLKLLKAKVKFLRLGQALKVHTKIQPYTDSKLSQNMSVEELDKIYMQSQLVATTCLGVNHYLFKRRRFDYCIMDEASQVSLPVSLGPLRHADKFILVGDLYQLPPLVASKNAYNKGLGVSLFKCLSESHPEALVELRHQYRMSQDIMSLSNNLIYGGKLECGTSTVASQSLKLPKLEDYLISIHESEYHEKSTCWIQSVFMPKRCVVFVNTDYVECKTSVANIEAIITTRIADAAIGGGLPISELGIISPYRMQIRQIQKLLKNKKLLNMQTVDRSQGSDYECVILSISSSYSTENNTHLLSDWRRLNVALTRARSKFIIVGSLSIMEATPCLQDLLKFIIEKDWYINIEPNAPHLEHQEELLINQLSSQVSQSQAVSIRGLKREGESEVTQNLICKKNSPYY